MFKNRIPIKGKIPNCILRNSRPVSPLQKSAGKIIILCYCLAYAHFLSCMETIQLQLINFII